MRSLALFQLAALTALTAFGAPALASDTRKPPVAAAPATLQAVNSSEVAGTVTLTWQPVKGVSEYIVASSRETEASWQSVAVTSSRLRVRRSPGRNQVLLPRRLQHQGRTRSVERPRHADYGHQQDCHGGPATTPHAHREYPGIESLIPLPVSLTR